MQSQLKRKIHVMHDHSQKIVDIRIIKEGLCDKDIDDVCVL
jgi:hypothetical protein